MMLRKGGFSFEMNLDREVIRVQNLSKSLTDLKPTILKAMGVQAVSWAVQDYRAKSDGGPAGGITWQPITLSAARNRLSHRAPYQDQTSQLKRLSEEQKPLTEALRRRLPKGKDDAKKAAQRKGSSGHFMNNTPEGKQLQRIKNKRKKIRERRKKMIEKEQAAARIGVDTGRLVNSLVYAVAELSAIKPPKLQSGSGSPTPALFTVQGDSIHIGSLMKYATYFDEKRPIFGPTFIDSGRRQQLDNLIETTIRASLKQRGGSP